MIFNKNSYYKRKFSKVSLNNKTIKSIEFEDCIFDQCHFIECKFKKCKFLNCKFKNCVLSAVILVDSYFNEINFINSKVTGVDWTKALKVKSISFDNCKLNYSNFKLLKLPGLRITKSSVKDVDFTEADLTEGNFGGTDFEKSRFFKTNLTRANFKKAKNYLIDGRHNTLKKTKFSLPEALSLLNSLDIVIED